MLNNGAWNNVGMLSRHVHNVLRTLSEPVALNASYSTASRERSLRQKAKWELAVLHGACALTPYHFPVPAPVCPTPPLPGNLSLPRFHLAHDTREFQHARYLVKLPERPNSIARQ